MARAHVYRVLSLALALGGPALLAGCGGGGGSSAPSAQTVTTTGQYQALAFTLTAKDVYARGQKVPYTFTVKNTGAQPIQFAVTAPEADAEITQGTNLVWQYTRSGGFPGGGGFLTLAPGESRTVDGTWDQTDLQGAAVPIGQYTLKVWLLDAILPGGLSIPDKESLLAAAPITITIR